MYPTEQGIGLKEFAIRISVFVAAYFAGRAALFPWLDGFISLSELDQVALSVILGWSAVTSLSAESEILQRRDTYHKLNDILKLLGKNV